ncbi:MAG: VCBS repeat-containing protein [Candidatus Hydrogenedentes bacterium]|nr:VCBS repeat-containing protein [Candidatus Hydrogenedentota bacterium]
MVSIIATLLVLGAQAAVPPDELLTLAPGWTATVVATVDQSYVGWDVEIGDADSDGKNEILTTGCPDSRLYLFKKGDTGWETHLLAENLAERKPGMGLAVRVADLNRDGANELVLGTGQEGEGTAFLYVFRTDGMQATPLAVSRPDCNKSGFTHNLAFHDLDNDGIDEIVSAYCSGGEIVRYDLDPALSRIDARLLHTLSGSGEEALIMDVDNDGAVEFITSNSFREGRARVEIFEFDAKGELVAPARIALDGFEGNLCFYASIIVGDVDNDGANEMIAGWKREQKVNKATLIGYRIGETAEPVYTFERETEDLDMGYFEKMMAIADADNDGKNELVVSTRGDNMSELIGSQHLGHVFRYTVGASGAVTRELLANFNEQYAESSWLAVGDADNDGRNEVVLATGKGDRTQPGTSYVVLLER